MLCEYEYSVYVHITHKHVSITPEAFSRYSKYSIDCINIVYNFAWTWEKKIFIIFSSCFMNGQYKCAVLSIEIEINFCFLIKLVCMNSTCCYITFSNECEFIIGRIYGFLTL